MYHADMSSPTPPGLPPQSYGMPPATPKKAKGPLFWILIAVGVLMVFGFLAVAGVSYFVYRGVKNAGLDPALMKSNPGLATAKLMVAVIPDLQTMSTDEGRGYITVREKSTGKVMTMRFDTDKKQLVVVGDDGKETTFSTSGDGNNGSFQINSPDGNLKIGAGAGNNMPAWMPVYPGSSPKGTMSTQTSDGNTNTFGFETSDGTEKVIDYYQKQLMAAGFQMSSRGGGDYGGLLTAQDADKKRTVMVSVSPKGSGSSGSITLVEKK